MTVHLIKLSVGTKSLVELRAWQSTVAARNKDGLPAHVTRMFPKRVDDVLDGGSIYWVFDGLIQCRQKILRLDEVLSDDGVRRCAIILDPELVATTQVRKRPFQGWRYLQPADAPPDLSAARQNDDTLPAELQAQLADIGVL